MASFRYLLDNDVRGVSEAFPSKQVRQLEDVGLSPNASDEAVVEEASFRALTLVTHNRKDFERFVPERIAESTKSANGCTQVHGLIILLPSTLIEQIDAIRKAAQRLTFKGKSITWKDVHERCLKVIVQAGGNFTVSELPRCPHCLFDDKES